MADYGSLPFAEALAFLRAKLTLPTARWDDLRGAAHDRAFVVAGAMQADLLMDLRAAVDKAIADGATIEQFRRDFSQITPQGKFKMAEFLIGLAIGFLTGDFVRAQIDKADFKELQDKMTNGLDAIERKIRAIQR